MSVTMMGLAWYVKGLTPAQKAVLVALADHAHDDGTNVYPGVKRLCIKTSLAERTVRRALSDLRSKGIIRIVKRAKFHSTTEYRLDLPEMQALQERPVFLADEDLPESPQGVPESVLRPARDAPKPSVNTSSKPSLKTTPIKPGDFGVLFDYFLEVTGIDERLLNARKARDEIVERWLPAEVTLEEIRQSVEYMQQRELTIAGPWSITGVLTQIRTNSQKPSGADIEYEEVTIDGQLLFRPVKK